MYYLTFSQQLSGTGLAYTKAVRQFIIYTYITLSCVFVSYNSVAQNADVDTQWHVNMAPVTITAERAWANDTVQYRYNQMKYYVTTVMPYVNEAVALQQELEAKIAGEQLSRKERKQLVKKREEALKARYEDEVKKLNETQGVLMIKLIARQTGVNIYDMLSEYKNPLAATKWLGWARLHGFNINKRYDPDKEPILENIMESLDYPLPSFYEERIIQSSN